MKTGSKSVVCNVVQNTWSDAARAASAEARRIGRGPSEIAASSNEHVAAAGYHSKMQKILSGVGDYKGAELHEKAMDKHNAALGGDHSHSFDLGRAMQAAKANQASKRANAHMPMDGEIGKDV